MPNYGSKSNSITARLTTRSFDPSGAEPRIFLQKVPEPNAGKNRAHFDVAVPDEGEAVERLRARGPGPVARDFRARHWTVLADPEGNEFCVGDFG